MKRVLAVLFLLLAGVGRAGAQEELASSCERAEVAAIGADEACLAAVQAAISGQPSLGLVIAGGNPTFGTAGGTGLRLNVVPRTTASLRLNVVGVKLPGIIADEIGGTLGDAAEKFGAPIPSLLGDMSIALTEGFSPAPGLGGIGAISAIGSLSYLPFGLVDLDGFNETPDFAWGIGARVHLLNESFIAPGLSASVIRRSLSPIQFGNICRSGFIQGGVSTGSPPVLTGTCAGEGDLGEFRLNLTDWSGRLVASKNLLALNLGAGIGYDRFSSDLSYGFRAPETVPGSSATTVYRVGQLDLESERYTVFGSASLTILLGTLGVEAGWQQGEAPITNFRDIDTDFTPEDGTWFGTLGLRLSI